MELPRRLNWIRNRPWRPHVCRREFNRDFKHCNLRTVPPKYYQYVNFPTRDQSTLDHVYSDIRDAYKAVPRPHFGLFDHISLFLFPANRQRLKQTTPLSKQVKLWFSDTEGIVQDCFAHTDWDVFKDAATQEDSSMNIEDYTEYVTGYISTCDDTIGPTIQVYPAAAGHNMGTAVSAVPVCTAGVQRLYCCHCPMPSVHSGTGTERQRVNEREKRI
eukprot:superscaffoldBa00002011_g12866